MLPIYTPGNNFVDEFLPLRLICNIESPIGSLLNHFSFIKLDESVDLFAVGLELKGDFGLPEFPHDHGQTIDDFFLVNFVEFGCFPLFNGLLSFDGQPSQ